MKRYHRIIIGACVALVSLGGVATAKEESIHRETLPGPVRDALAQRYPGAEFRGFTHEREKGVDLYEAEMTVSGRRVDASFEATGRLREEEAEIAASDLPEPVRRSHDASAQGHWKIERVERIRSSDSSAPPSYELRVFDGRQRVEVRYASDGRRLSGHKADPND
ncbi:MAG: hypothetical protein ACHQ52_03670 [Candidatus Eisenbacteria bacterium]